MDSLDFDLQDVTDIGFGVGLLPKSSPTFHGVSADQSVKDELRAMVDTTWELLSSQEGPTEYNPAEKYAGMEQVYLPLTSTSDTFLPELYAAGRLPHFLGSLRSSAKIFCYLTVSHGRSGSTSLGIA